MAEQHWDTCWKVHHQCAINKVEELLARVQSWIDQYKRLRDTNDRLIEEIKHDKMVVSNAKERLERLVINLTTLEKEICPTTSTSRQSDKK